jgi:mannosylfructose-phosphate synthase
MIRPNQDDSALRQQFLTCGRRHILMITNHGVHEWEVVPGLPDTGGQNVYVNQLTEALVQLGYRVTIVNRGGYPHPTTGMLQKGMRYHASGLARIVYIEDHLAEFVRKEDMDEQLPALARDLEAKLDAEQDDYELIISNYWDAAKLGNILNASRTRRVPHVWIPHSLGALKKHNMHPSTWAKLRIDERIANEKEIVRHIDGGVSTSAAIRETFREDYGYEAKYFLPPCINEHRYHPRTEEQLEPIWPFLASHTPLTLDQIRRRKLVTEISRTDKTKRKNVLIEAFAKARASVPDALLVVSIDPHARELYDELQGLIDELGIREDVIVLGSVWEQLPLIYAATSVYCTPSVMEGFGMTAQEAAATGKPVISSDLVPFAVEYLATPAERLEVGLNGEARELQVGKGAIIAAHDDVPAFAGALMHVLKDDELREAMGRRAHEITIPYFTWKNMTAKLLGDLGFAAEDAEAVGSEAP